MEGWPDRLAAAHSAGPVILLGRGALHLVLEGAPPCTWPPAAGPRPVKPEEALIAHSHKLNPGQPASHAVVT